MKVKYIGASVRQGLSAKDNSPYTIGEVSYAIPDKNAAKADPDGKQRWVYTCHGDRVQTIQLDPACLSQFAKCVPGTDVELIIAPLPTNPRNNHCVGVK